MSFSGCEYCSIYDNFYTALFGCVLFLPIVNCKAKKKKKKRFKISNKTVNGRARRINQFFVYCPSSAVDISA
jgi:hypothetical protein